MKREETYEHRSCEICGSDMYVSKKSIKRFCSDNCQNIWQRSNTGFKNKRFQGRYLTCDFCGKEYIVGKYRAELRHKHFCSTTCRQQWYATVWSQADEWREESRKRTLSMLNKRPVTTQTKPQIVCNKLLEDLGITFRNEEPFVYYSVDNYLTEYNLIIEVMGDYWHSSPIKYPEVSTDKQRYIVSRDKAKHTYILNYHNIDILYLWESDLNKRPALCRDLISIYVENGGKLQNYHSFNYSLSDGTLELNDTLIEPHQDRCLEIAC